MFFEVEMVENRIFSTPLYFSSKVEDFAKTAEKAKNNPLKLMVNG